MTVTVKAEHVFKEPVEVVAATHLGKFPNEYDPNIVACNTVDRKKVKSNINYTKRVALVRNVLPSLLKRTESLQADHFEIEEECWWDKKKREFMVQSQNRSLNDWIDMRESSSFIPHQQNSNWTQFDQVGTITVHGMGRLGTIIELFGQRFLSVGAQRGIKITESLIAERSKKLTSMWYSEFLFA